jgi:hypothetical protein
MGAVKRISHVTAVIPESFPSKDVINTMLAQSKKRTYCRGCGEFFTSVSAFDLHQVGNDVVECRAPDNISPKIKLVDRRLEGMPRPLWGQPGESPLGNGRPIVWYESLPGEPAGRATARSAAGTRPTTRPPTPAWQRLLSPALSICDLAASTATAGRSSTAQPWATVVHLLPLTSRLSSL